MRIRITRKPDIVSIDGLRLDGFEAGLQYEVGTLLGAYLLAEGWAEPVPDDEPASVVPLNEAQFLADKKRLDRRHQKPPFRRGRIARAADRHRRRR